MNCKKFNDLVFSYLDGQLSGQEKTEFEHHQHACAACAGLLRDTGKIAGLLQDAAAPVPAPDWERSWRRIDAAVKPSARRQFSLFFSPRLAWLSAAFLAFFVLGIAVARLYFFPDKAQTSVAGDPAFTFTAQDYFSALQPVMAEYSNARNPGEDDSASQARVRRLLSDLYLLKLQAEKTRNTSLQHLLADIELVLLEMAHLDRSDPENVRQVGALIQEKGIPLKMKVYKFEDRNTVRI